ncbi:MAG: ABC transporter permease [bacterium]
MRKIIEPIVWLAGILTLWEIACQMKWVPGYVAPPPSAVFHRLLTFTALLPHLYVTLYEVLLGLSLASVVGIGLAVVMAHSEHLQTLFYPLVVFSHMVPQSALAPFYVILFGFGPFPKILVTFFITFFPMLMNTMSGLTITEPELLDLVRSLRATKLQILTKIRLPRSLPFIFSGLKIAGPGSVIGAIVAEFIIGDMGLGYLVQISVHLVDTTLLFSVITCMAVVGIILFEVPFIAEKILLPWYKR